VLRLDRGLISRSAFLILICRPLNRPRQRWLESEPAS